VRIGTLPRWNFDGGIDRPEVRRDEETAVVDEADLTKARVDVFGAGEKFDGFPRGRKVGISVEPRKNTLGVFDQVVRPVDSDFGCSVEGCLGRPHSLDIRQHRKGCDRDYRHGD
jgi:hypothetical protein